MSGSGNIWSQSGDVKTDRFLISCKRTEHVAFRLQRYDLEEILEDAFVDGKIPALALEIGGEKVWVFFDSNVSFNDEGGVSIE